MLCPGASGCSPALKPACWSATCPFVPPPLSSSVDLKPPRIVRENTLPPGHELAKLPHQCRPWSDVAMLTEGPSEVAQYGAHGTKYKAHTVTQSHSLSGPPEGQQASRATKGGGAHHQSACASWPGEGFVLRGNHDDDEARPRSSEPGRKLSAYRLYCTAVVTFSTCSRVVQPPSRLLCPERHQRDAFFHGRPGVRHPTNPRSASVCGASASRIRACIRSRRTPRRPASRGEERELSTDPTRARQRWLGS